MNIQRVLRTDAEKAFIVCRNITGTAISDGVPVEWDVVSVTDGNAVTQCKSSATASLFVGLTDAIMADSAYGLVQVYGFRTSAYLSASSGVSTPGSFCRAVSGHLKPVTLAAATSSGHTYVVLMATNVLSAVISYENVFIRAL